MTKKDLSKSHSNNPAELSDEELMELYKAGDFTAFESLYSRHSGRVYEYLRSKSSNEVAQELLQEIFEKLHVSREKYNSQFPFLPWLFTISRNTLFDHYKKSESKLTSRQVYSEEILSTLPSTDSAGSFSESSDLKSETTIALKKLPDQQRKAIELRYLQDWSFEKIAQELKTSEVNARKLISRALAAMKNSTRKETP